MFHFKRVSLPFLMAAFLLHADTATDDFLVTATVIDTCSVSAGNLDFGTYNPLAASPTDGTSTITITCVLGTSYTIALGVGGGSGAAYSTGRIMSGDTNTSATLTYNLYTDSGHSTVWGDSTDSSSTVSGSGQGPLSAISHTVYGSIPINQNVPAQGYTDTITATIEF